MKKPEQLDLERDVIPYVRRFAAQKGFGTIVLKVHDHRITDVLAERHMRTPAQVAAEIRSLESAES